MDYVLPVSHNAFILCYTLSNIDKHVDQCVNVSVLCCALCCPVLCANRKQYVEVEAEMTTEEENRVNSGLLPGERLSKQCLFNMQFDQF